MPGPVVASSEAGLGLDPEGAPALHLPGGGLRGIGLGTLDLLFGLKQKGSLPEISDQPGNRVRTNAESLIDIGWGGPGSDRSGRP
jgi:hypothetical protein